MGQALVKMDDKFGKFEVIHNCYLYLLQETYGFVMYGRGFCFNIMLE